jgi:integrase
MFGKAPTVYRIQMYLLWLAETRTGLLEENITDTTVRNRLSSLKRAIKLFTRRQYSSAENKDIENYIEKELVHKGKISTDAYKKPVAPLLVAEDLIQFLWMCDEYQFTHPRARLQLAFAIILMTFTGSRPGEFIESEAWKHSNEGLLYGDIDLVRYQNETYVGFLLLIRLRNRKGHRNNKKHS